MIQNVTRLQSGDELALPLHWSRTLPVVTFSAVTDSSLLAGGLPKTGVCTEKHQKYSVAMPPISSAGARTATGCGGVHHYMRSGGSRAIDEVGATQLLSRYLHCQL